MVLMPSLIIIGLAYSKVLLYTGLLMYAFGELNVGRRAGRPSYLAVTLQLVTVSSSIRRTSQYITFTIETIGYVTHASWRPLYGRFARYNID